MLFALWVLCLGCRDDGGADDSSPSPGLGFGEFTTTQAAAMSTVLTVEFTTDSAAVCHIQLGPTADNYAYRTASELEARTEHRFVVPGFPAGATSHWQASCDVDGEALLSNDQIHETSPPPPDLPSFEVGTIAAGNAGGYRFVPWITTTDGGFLIFNAEGDLVWWYQTGDGDFLLAAHQSNDSQGVWWNINDAARVDGDSTLEYVRWDGEDPRSIATEWAHHDFEILPGDEGFLYIGADIREVNGQDVAGDTLRVITEDGGDAVTLWSTWDQLTPIPNFTNCSHWFYPNMCDWVHANTVFFDPTDDRYYLSLSGENAFARISSTGQTEAIVGTSVYADVNAVAVSDRFVDQHGIQPWPFEADTYVLFDNGPAEPEFTSRVTRVKVDGDTFSIVWEYDGGEPLHSVLMGDADPVGDDGNTLISWGSEGRIDEVTDDQELVFQIQFLSGSIATFLSWYPTLGGPI